MKRTTVLHSKIRCFLWLATTCALAITVTVSDAWAQTTLELRDRVDVKESSILRLDQLTRITDRHAEISRQLGELSLFPVPEDTVAISRQQISDRLALLGVDLFDIRWTGAEHVVVANLRSRSTGLPAAGTEKSSAVEASAPNQTVTPWKLDTLERDCRRSLEKELQAAGLEFVELSIPQASRALLTNESTVRRVGYVEELKEGVNDLAVELDSGGELSTVSVQLKAAESPKAIYLKRPLQRGQIVQAQHLELRPVTEKKRRADWLFNSSEVIGKEMVFSVNANTPLTLRSIRERVLVRSNSDVVVEAAAGNIRVRTHGKATQEGAFGDSITVELPNRRGKVMAEVVGEGRVEVRSASSGQIGN